MPVTEEVSKLRKNLNNVLIQVIKYVKWSVKGLRFISLYRLDRQGYFMEPVTEDIAPDYFKYIPHPMDFKTIKKKLKDGKYDSGIESMQVSLANQLEPSLNILQDDFQLICNNCMTYNPPQTSFFKEAKRLLGVGMHISQYCC